MAVRRPNSRAHDLIDLQLIVANGKVDLARTRETCERLFAYRRMHTWPPTVVENEGWASIYAEQAAGLDVLPDVAEAVVWTNALILSIAHA